MELVVICVYFVMKTGTKLEMINKEKQCIQGNFIPFIEQHGIGKNYFNAYSLIR